MSVDLVDAISVGATVVTVAILVLGIYRALEMRGGFGNSAYRSRATWSAFLMLIILILMVTNFINFPSSGILSFLGALPFLALIFTIFAYADGSVRVAMETDFFHRDTLGWSRMRWPAMVVLVFFVIGAFGGTAVSNLTAQEQYWVDNVVNLFFFAVAAIIAYSAAALILGARRSSDRTLRRSILFLGLALCTLVVSLVATSFLSDGTLPYVIVNKGTGVVGIYLIYRSAMSLSPIGKIERDAESPVSN